jgi:hypothetical protein
LGDAQAAENIVRINNQIAENDKFRKDAQTTVSDIKSAQLETKDALVIAGLLSGGDAEGRSKIITDAPGKVKALQSKVTSA